MTAILNEPLKDATVWKSADIVERSDWLHTLDRAELDDIDAALSHAKATGKPATELTRDDFPLKALLPQIERWMKVLHRGAGFINVKGLPVDRYSEEDLEKVHWGIGTYMGTGVSQNAAGDLLSHIRDVGANPGDRSKRLYKTNIELGFHSDGSDIVALLCLKQAPWGGKNRLASCGAIYNEILQRRSDLIPLLYENFSWDRNEEQGPGEDPFFNLPICSYHDGLLRFFYIGWYIRNAQRHAQVPRLSAEQIQLLDLIDEIALDPEFHLEFRLVPGEIAYLKNSAALHMRTAYEDYEEPELKRHLIRMWLTAHGHWADSDAFVQQGIPVRDGVASDVEDISRDDGA
ncbi:MAG: TauD/TfdA family dioxygenase [bacterium]|nr:TauD/TfdA family dioxygenase [bacterium]